MKMNMNMKMKIKMEIHLKMNLKMSLKMSLKMMRIKTWMERFMREVNWSKIGRHCVNLVYGVNLSHIRHSWNLQKRTGRFLFKLIVSY